MLHDLLAAMKGHGGGIFVWRGSKFKVNNDLGLLHPCEVAIVEEIMDVATDFKKITSFCDAHDGGGVETGDHHGGIYLSSLSAALRATATTTFHRTVLELEEKLLFDPELPLTTALVAVRPLGPTLATLATLVTQIEEKHLHGCQILETVHKLIALSVGQVKEVLSRIEQKVHAVLYHQLTLWLLHGLLLDPHQEFFISTCASSPSSSANTTMSTTSSLSQQTETLSLEESTDKMSSTPECHLRLEMLPAHIPLSVAEKVLFIGEFILVFEHGALRENGESRPSLASSRSGQVLKKREGEFRGLLADLAAEQTFSVDKFSRAIETIRNCVSEELWKLVMEADLLGELSDLKAVFLLGRGELFQALVPIITPFLLTPADPCADLTELFRSAGRQVLMEDSVLEKFTLSLKMPPTTVAATSTHTSEEQWGALRLTYSARWPLHKLLTSTAQDKYNAIFTFLLDVRRAQHRLQQLWLVQSRGGRLGEGSCLRWTLRHHMALLIDNIQYYLQADVLESQHWQLVKAVNETQDYQQLVAAHHVFLASVAAQCFLHSPVVARAIHCLLGLVHRFCAHLESFVGNGSTDREMVESLHEEFERAAAQLFFMLSNLRLHRAEQQQHTSQLIMRIDYNRYYSRHSGSLQRLTAACREGQ
ncbi:hypothetical protein O3P69_003091 [Scylla paramamosain]|uniref:Gamma-tubulin complex component n=2 Tax=Scylla paramamosain TaxID=85552 RepID=A0AAW0UJX9_SCYPA